VSLAAGPAVLEWRTLDGWASWAAGDHVLEVRVLEGSATLCDHAVLPVAPSALHLQSAAVTATAADAVDEDGALAIVLETSGNPALFVTLTTLADGRFSDNAVLLRPGAPRTVTFIPFGPLDMALLAASLRVEHLAMYMSS
jgi:hypothetical protein